MELLGPYMRVLGANEGLPTLPEVTYHLWIRPGSLNPLTHRACDLIRHSCRF